MSAPTCYAFTTSSYFGDLLAPFAMLPNRFGGTIWNVMSLLSLLYGLRAFAAEFSDATSRVTATVVLMVTTLAIGLGSFWNSQANVLILASLLWGSVFVSQQRLGSRAAFLRCLVSNFIRGHWAWSTLGASSEI